MVRAVGVGRAVFVDEVEVLALRDGYGNRFGLIYVDFETLERTPKLSAEWFRVAARQNAVV